MTVDKKSPIPVYYQLKKILQQEIEEGKYKENDLIPSERELSELYAISRMTVRQALNQLVNEGLLYREKGRGTFVSRKKIEQRNLMSFSDIVRSRGFTPSAALLSFTKELPKPELLELLDLDKNDQIFVIKRLRRADGTPVGIEEAFIPVKHCPRLKESELTSSLFSLMNHSYGYVIRYEDNVIEASKPSKHERDLLGIAINTPLLRVSSLKYTESGLKLFYEKSVYSSEIYKYNVRVHMSK